MNRDDYTYICRQTNPKEIRNMTPKQLMRCLAEIREYAVDSMMQGCEGCIDFKANRKDAHCSHCSRNMGDFFRRQRNGFP